MANGYTTTIKRIMVAALLIATSAYVQASDHGMMVTSKRHKLSCKQLILLALGLSAATQTIASSVPDCVHIIGDNENIGLFEIDEAVCTSSLGYEYAAKEPTLVREVSAYVAGKIDARMEHSAPSVVELRPTPCPQREGRDGKHITYTTTCLSLGQLEATDITYRGPAAPKAQLPAPVQ